MIKIKEWLKINKEDMINNNLKNVYIQMLCCDNIDCCANKTTLLFKLHTKLNENNTEYWRNVCKEIRNIDKDY